MDVSFEEYITEAEMGKNILETSFHASGLDGSLRTAILIFPEDNEQLLKTAFSFLEEFFESYDAAIIVNSLDTLPHLDGELSGKILYYYRINDFDMQKVLRFFSFTQSIPHIKVISISRPFNQKSEDLVGFKDVTIDKLVYHCMYGLF